ncbi:MAG: hypothetical protein K0U66_09125 [Gammaproteobacteria bacterium]|nr:hypothetical protein [Gammaproteobacteria bacterium]
MKRSRYYRPAGLATGTIAMTVLAAVVVFSSVLYLNFFHEEHTRLFSSSRYPPDYPPTPAVRLYDDAGAHFTLGADQCGFVILALFERDCPSNTAEHRSTYREFSGYLDTIRTAAPPLYLVSPVARSQTPATIPSAHSPTQCRDCSAGACLNAVRSDRDSTDRLYQHFNQPYDLSKPSDTPCPDTDSAPWILIDGRGQAKLYFHTRPHAAATRAAEMARDYLTVLAESTREDSADTGHP